MRRTPLIAALVLLGVTLSGCMDFDPFYEFDADEHYRNPGVFEGLYQMGGDGSLALVRGNLTAGFPEVVRLVSNLPAYAGPLAESGDAQVDITMAIWRPQNATGPVPIIVDAGPYFEQGTMTIDMPSQTTPFNAQNYLGAGYAIVQLAIRGTGTSGGCMDLMGPAEQHDLDQAITWLGEQPWSNGRIAMVGASYDGSTPWIVAATGNPYLKTIVPTSGLPDIYDLMFKNGSAETRGAIMHNQVYWGFGFSPGFPQRPDVVPSGVPWLVPAAGMGNANGRAEYQDRQNLLCPEVYEGSVLGQYAVANGDRGAAFSSYWTERDYRQRVIDNYKGSVFLIHGLQDWNVDPHSAIPFNAQLRAAGIEMKEWYGQWGHSFPDSAGSSLGYGPGILQCAEGPSWAVLPCRLDFAEVLRRWFEHYLKDNQTLELGPSIQVQDNVGFWRNADSYPPVDAAWTPLRLTADGRLSQEGGASGEVELMPPTSQGPGDYVALVSEPLEEELHLSGLPQLRLPFEVEGQGAHIAAWLFDQDPKGQVRAPAVTGDSELGYRPVGLPVVGHAQMNLRYYAGGDEPQPLVPQQRYIAKMEFEPLEVRVPAGHRLVLWLFQYHYPDHQDSMTPGVVRLLLDEDAALRLPVVDVDPRTVFPVPGAHFLNHTYVPEMYVPMPLVPPALPPAPLPDLAHLGPPYGPGFGRADGVDERETCPVCL